jgi:hypothetical protein
MACQAWCWAGLVGFGQVSFPLLFFLFQFFFFFFFFFGFLFEFDSILQDLGTFRKFPKYSI